MKLSTIIEMQSRSFRTGSAEYFIKEIQKRVSQPFDIPAEYVNIYNKVNRKARINEQSLQQYLQNYLAQKFKNASYFANGQVSTNPSDYKFDVAPDLVASLAPGNTQAIYNAANKRLRLYYFSIIKGDDAAAKAEEQKQANEDIQLLFNVINEDDKEYTRYSRAYFYNILLIRKFIELLMDEFVDAHSSLALKGAAYENIPKREWFKQLYKELSRTDVTTQQVIEAMPQEFIDMLKKALSEASKAKKFIDYFGELQKYIGNDNFESFRNALMAS
jgi:hypothetical protein